MSVSRTAMLTFCTLQYEREIVGFPPPTLRSTILRHAQRFRRGGATSIDKRIDSWGEKKFRYAQTKYGAGWREIFLRANGSTAYSCRTKDSRVRVTYMRKSTWIVSGKQINLTGAGSHRFYIFEDWENYTDLCNINTVTLLWVYVLKFVIPFVEFSTVSCVSSVVRICLGGQ
jgi:hypothetical protein